jgi:hypothetical protein
MPDYGERIVGEIATELAQAKMLLKALKALGSGSCWCEGDGYHSELCKEVQLFLSH